jgi:biotin transport system substrate-specific component
MARERPVSAVSLTGGAPVASVVWSRVSGAVQVVGFALLTIVAAKIRVSLPFTPVPGTFQLIPVLLSGVFLGARAGATSQILYLSLGMAGAPVFALAGAGPAYLLGPTGGFLLGFVAASCVTGALRGRLARFGVAGLGLTLLSGALALHLCGFAWLTVFLKGDPAAALRAGALPFLLFDLAKLMMAIGIVEATRRVRRRIMPGRG